jgi:hypothetical protein
MVRLKSIGVLSAAKISGLLYAGLSLLIVPLILMMSAATALVPKDEKQPPVAFFIAFAVVAPFLYGAIGFVVGALSAFVYNLVAGWIGGVEMHFENVPSTPLPHVTAAPTLPSPPSP